MADIHRKASAVWQGGLRDGSGQISTSSGAIKQSPYSFGTRFRNSPGTNPEELLAAAHAACFSMNLAGVLGAKGYAPESIETQATCTLAPIEGGFRITAMRLDTQVKVAGIDEQTLQGIAREAERTCPITNVLRPDLKIDVFAKLA